MSLASLLPPVALPVRAAASRSDAAAAPRCTGVVRGSLPCSKKLLAGLQAPAQAPARCRSAARRSARPAAAADGKEEPTGWDGISEGENYKTQAGKEATLLFQMDTPHNNIKVVELPKDNEGPLKDCRILLLDDFGNIHSIWKNGTLETQSYWDEYSALQPLLPEGPLALLGLGSGTILHQYLHYWPGVKVEGWEIDGAVLLAARQHLGLEKLEAAGVVSHVGDALDPELAASRAGEFAAVMVDLFTEGRVIPQLTEADTWRRIQSMLLPGGRVMANMGGDGMAGLGDELAFKALDAMAEVFGEGSVHFRNLNQDEKSLAANFMSLTGDLPSMMDWGKQLPSKVMPCVMGWQTHEVGTRVMAVPEAIPEDPAPAPAAESGGFADVDESFGGFADVE